MKQLIEKITEQSEYSKFVLEMGLDNAAFSDDPGAEVARILRAAADKFEAGEDYTALMDLNGNKVGTAEMLYESSIKEEAEAGGPDPVWELTETPDREKDGTIYGVHNGRNSHFEATAILPDQRPVAEWMVGVLNEAGGGPKI